MANKFGYNGGQDEAFFGNHTSLWENGRFPLSSLKLVKVVAAGVRGGAAARVQSDGRHSCTQPSIYPAGDGLAAAPGHKHASSRGHENSGSISHVDGHPRDGRAHAYAYPHAQSDSHARSVCRFDD